MAASGKSKANQQQVLAANVPAILVELRRLAAANARTSVVDKGAKGGGGLAWVILGK